MFLFSSSRFLILALSLYSILVSSWCESGQDVPEWMCADDKCSGELEVWQASALRTRNVIRNRRS